LQVGKIFQFDAERAAGKLKPGSEVDELAESGTAQ
jgi:hypothetical protein